MEQINLATYSFGMGSGMSMADMLSTAAQMGAIGVELSGDFMKTPSDEMNKMLSDNKLKAVSAHLGLDQVPGALQYLKEIGIEMVIVPMYFFASIDDTKALAEQLNSLGRQTLQHGIKLGYHNHTSEFFVVDGKPLMDHLIDMTDPKLVGFELDCGWAAAAGMDPAAYIRQHAGRFMAVHIKEVNEVIGVEQPQSTQEAIDNPPFKFDENGKPIISEDFIRAMQARNSINVATGQGIVDWADVRDALTETGGGAFILEREHSYNQPQDRVACLREDVQYMKDNL